MPTTNDLARAVALVAMVALAGCAAPAVEAPSGGGSDGPEPLPDPIHDERDVAVSSSGIGVPLPCGEAHTCVDHPFTLPREALVTAKLDWEVPGALLSLRILEGDEIVEVVGSDVDPAAPTELLLNATLPAGDYVLLVDARAMAADRWVLDAAFSEPVPWSGPFAPPQVAVEPCGICYEPTVAVDREGRIFAADGGDDAGDVAIGVSSDGGATFSPLLAPPPLLQAPPATKVARTDILLQTAPSGRLYWSAIVILVTEPYTQHVLEGIQVAWSDDGGATWAGNVHIDPTTRSSPVYAPDRQWLGFGVGETVYMTYNQFPTGIWIARSDDGGTTWGAWTRAIPFEGRTGGSNTYSPPVVNDAGTVYLAGCSGTLDATLVYRSEDGGRTFTSTSVPGGCIWFPILAARGDALVLAVHDRQDARVAWSRDGGVTFSEPKVWGTAASTAPWPLLLADGSLALVWHHTLSPTRAELHVTTGDDDPRDDVVIATVRTPVGRTSPAATDFTHAALTPDERIVAAWMDDGARVMVAAEVER